MREFKKGLEDSAQSIAVDATFARGYVRLAQCQMEFVAEDNFNQKVIATCEAGLVHAVDQPVKDELNGIINSCKNEI